MQTALSIIGNPSERCMIATFRSESTIVCRFIIRAAGKDIDVTGSVLQPDLMEKKLDEYQTELLIEFGKNKVNHVSMHALIMRMLERSQNLGLVPAMFEYLFQPRMMFEAWMSRALWKHPELISEAEATYAGLRGYLCHQVQAIPYMAVEHQFGSLNLVFHLYGEDDRPSDYVVIVSFDGVITVAGIGGNLGIDIKARDAALLRVRQHVAEHALLKRFLSSSFGSSAIV